MIFRAFGHQRTIEHSFRHKAELLESWQSQLSGIDLTVHIHDVNVFVSRRSRDLSNPHSPKFLESRHVMSMNRAHY